MQKLKVIYEDNHIIVVEKIPNIPSQADKTGDTDMLSLVKSYIKEKYNKPGNVYLGLVHRLDRPVGGIMIFAKTSKAASRLSNQVREKIFKKKYLAVVEGKFEKEEGILENYLAVGDIVTYNNFTGEVLELGLRVTKIKAFNGEVMVVANRNINTIINGSQKKADIFIEIDTAYEEKNEKVEKILKEVIDGAIKDKLILPDSKYLGVNELGASSVKYVIDVHCDQVKKYSVRREMLKRIKIAYEENNIKIPYNQLEVHHGADI